jgi:hypothetical protein
MNTTKITIDYTLDREPEPIDITATGFFTEVTYALDDPSRWELESVTYSPDGLELTQDEKETIEQILYEELGYTFAGL